MLPVTAPGFPYACVAPEGDAPVNELVAAPPQACGCAVPFFYRRVRNIARVDSGVLLLGPEIGVRSRAIQPESIRYCGV